MLSGIMVVVAGGAFAFTSVTLLPQVISQSQALPELDRIIAICLFTVVPAAFFGFWLTLLWVVRNSYKAESAATG